jgi:uncharacterized repeat protein (TIGR03803 family)
MSMAAIPALAIAFSANGAKAAKFTVLHSFVGGSSDGANPLGGVAPAGHGSFYVATDAGGASGKGTLTLLRGNGTTQVLHAFAGGRDGQNADGTPLVWSSYDRNVYGTTQFGGAAGRGSTYRYLPGSGAYQQLHAFACGGDGAFPFAGLSEVEEGGEDFLLASGYNGGPSDGGTMIFVNQDGNSGASCVFSGSNGKNPFASFVGVGDNSYTVTTTGGSNNLGVVMYFDFHCNPTVLHNFTGGSADGAAAYGRLLYYNNQLYGTTANGGAPNLGTVFRMNLNGSNYTILHAFQGICCGKDGSFPRSGLKLNSADGMLYGTTINGGNSSDNGTVFKINPKTGKEKLVHAFSGSDGAHPYGDLYIKKGTIYGTTQAGGASNLGVVFALKS